MTFGGISTLKGRWLLLGCVVLLPFIRFLLRNNYPLLRPESLASAAVLAIVCLILAFLARTRLTFLILAAAASVMMATVPVVRMLAPWVDISPRSASALLGGLLALAIFLMREKFAVILAAFTLSAFGVDLTQALAARFSYSIAANSPTAAPAGHLLYIVLDEHIGAAGLPTEINECAAARESLEQTLSAGGFRHYTHAYSNYPSTVSSLSSLLNRQLLERRRMFLDENSPQWRWGTRTFKANRVLSEFKSRGYRLELYQHRAINHAAPGVAVDSLHEYWDSLGQLEQSPGSWQTRFRWLVGNYQQSDLVLSQVKAFFPFRFAPHTTGPLSAAGIWTGPLLRDITHAPSRTLFFVHLMSPHFPYLYRRDGTVRDLAEWTHDRVDQRSSEPMYADRYRRYCEQVQFVSSQLGTAFDQLRAASVYDAMTIVIHGDHGSRIRKAFTEDGNASRAAGSDPEAYDYPRAPALEDLLDRFSALYAIKQPGSGEGTIEARPQSLLRLLSQSLPLDGADGLTPQADSVYLFDGAGNPRQIDLLKVWTHPRGTP